MVARVEEADHEVETGLALLNEAPSAERARLLLARAQIREHHRQDYKEAMEDVETALGWLPNLPDDLKLLADLEILKGVLHSLDTDHLDHLAAQWSFEAALEAYEALGNRGMVGFCYRQIGFALLGQGKTEEAADFIEAGAKIAEEMDEKWTLICKAWFLVESLGDYEEAEQIYDKSFELIRKTDHPEKVWEYRLLSDLYRRQGRYEEARETLGYFLEVSRGIINVYRRVESLALVARLCLLNEDVEEAERYLAEAESERGETASKWLDLDVAWARGMIQAAKGEMSGAETAFRKVMEEPAVPDGRRGHVMDYLATFVDRGEALLDFGLVLSYWGKKERAKEVLTQTRNELKAHGRKPLERKALAALRSLESSQ